MRCDILAKICWVQTTAWPHFTIFTAFDLDIHMLAAFASIVFILIVHPFMYLVITYLLIIYWDTTILNVIVVITVRLLKLENQNTCILVIILYIWCDVVLFYQCLILGLLVISNAVVEDTKRRVPDNTLPESKETDRVLEQYSLTDILRTIDSIQSRVLRLQGHLSKVCSNHAQVKVPPKSQKAQTQLASCKKDGHRPQKKRDLNSLLQEEDKRRPLVGVPTALSDRCTDYVMEYGERNIAEEGATQPHAKKVTFETLFGADNPLIHHAHLGELYKEVSSCSISFFSILTTQFLKINYNLTILSQM